MRKKIGIIFRYNENWIGGSYYILNLIHSLCLLNDDQKPEIYLLCDSKDDYSMVESETNYPYLKGIILPGSKEKWFKRIFSAGSVKKKIKNLEAIFPYPLKPVELYEPIKHKIIWIGDFQEKYVPQFFSKEAIANRENLNSKLSKGKNHLVFSSKCALSDFQKFYPDNNCFTYLLQFAVTHPQIESVKADELFAKYEVKAPYFISPNQFWIHKNHNLIIDAFYALKMQGFEYNLVFTGKEFDYRSPDYAENLKKKVNELGLSDSIKFLGFIDRRDQLALMKNAKAVIQASLFEGWSTVVEDCKALGCPIILSNLPVHQEQDPELVNWFDPTSKESLIAAIQKNFVSNKITYDYNNNRESFANQFMRILNSNSNE